MEEPTDNLAEKSPFDTPSSSQMDSFDFAIDSSDPLAFIMNASSSDHSGDSSTEESYRGTSTPPSSHGSPACSAALPQAKPMDTSAFSFLTQQAFDDGLEFPAGLVNDLSGIDCSMFDPSIFSNCFEGLNFPTNPQFPSQFAPTHPPTTDLPAYPFKFSQTVPVVPSTQSQPQPQPQDLSMLRPPEHHLNIPSPISSNSSTASSPLLNPSQFVAGSMPTMPLPAASTTGHSLQLPGDPTIDDLVQRARALVGVSMALPMADSSSEQLKVPIPRLQRPIQPPPVSKRKEMSSSPPASGPSFSTAAAPVRTKTAHTDIERRYRTNINDRIQSLRAAVPALRVLEERAGNRVGNLNIKGDAVDVIDERGYVDGVKVARKGSKANVLGKAVEYINVLKRRELRLTREKEGLRTLICSLVGGPALLKEWETMWADQFGGPETDEGQQNADQVDADDEDEDEDGDDAFGRQENTSNKKRKRSGADTSATKGKKDITPPISAASNPAFSVIAPGQPEKRKRGRPRKLPLPPPSSKPSPVVSMDVSMNPDALFDASSFVSMPRTEPVLDQQSTNQVGLYQVVQPGQYLLAAFAFFSFFNSPVSYYATSSMRTTKHHVHTGFVLDSHPDYSRSNGETAMTRVVAEFGWRDVVQVIHVAISLLLLLSIVGPWLPYGYRRRFSRALPRVFRPFLGLPYAPRPAPQSSPSNDSRRSSSDSSEDEREDAAARSILSSALVCTAVEPKQAIRTLRNALDLRPGFFGMFSSVLQVIFARSSGLHRLERRVLEQRVFTRLAELVALDVTASNATRIQTYVYASKFVSASSASASDLATLALVIQPLWGTKATALWDMALTRIHRRFGLSLRASKPFEILVLENMTVDEAMERIRSSELSTSLSSFELLADNEDESNSERDVDDLATSPLAFLARQLVLEFIRGRAEAEFVQMVFGLDADEAEARTRARGKCDLPVGDLKERQAEVVSAGRSLDRSVKSLVELYSSACGSASTPISPISDNVFDDEELDNNSDASDELEITSLLSAIKLHRRIFPTSRAPACDPVKIEPSVSQPPPVQAAHPSASSMPSPIPSSAIPFASFSSLSLRRRLASPAFDRSDILEDARDHVVELLQDGLMKEVRCH